MDTPHEPETCCRTFMTSSGFVTSVAAAGDTDEIRKPTQYGVEESAIGGEDLFAQCARCSLCLFLLSRERK